MLSNGGEGEMSQWRAAAPTPLNLPLVSHHFLVTITRCTTIK